MASSSDQGDEDNFNIRLRQDEEMEFFMELAVHEAERWITAVTRKKFSHPEDFRKSLENGVLLCELLNCIKPGTVKRINKLPTPIAGLDNINVFLNACRKSFRLSENQLFDPCDLEDLTQRAIADSAADLKAETDRRTLNVAICIFWLGKSVASSFSGPQLDQSAFAAIVHNHGKDIVTDGHTRQDSIDSSSAYGSHDSYSKSESNGAVNNKHSRYNSYDSYGSCSRDSEGSFNLDEDENMPAGTRSNMRRYGSAGSLNTNAGMRFSATGSVNVDDGSDLYQSNPDLTNNHHRRGSSTDSMDSSAYNHSRQSSEDIEIPTRTLRTQRKVSTSTVDPLQFVKSKPSDALAKQAVQQIKAAQEVKNVRTKIEKEDEDWQSITDTMEDWQSNLSSWKHKRRRASAATYQRVEETDNLVAEEEEKRKPKTYSEMVEAREKRKSTGMLNFYPVNDEDDSLTWTPKSPTKQELPKEEPIGRSHVSHSETAPSSRLVQRFKRSDTAPTVRESHAIHRADVKESAPVTMETVSKNRSKGDVKDMASTGHESNVKVVTSPDLTSNRERSLSSSSGGESYVKYNDQGVADWAKGEDDEESENKNKNADSANVSSKDQKADEVLRPSKTFDDKFNRGKSSDVTKRYSDIIPPWNRDSTKEKTPENNGSNAGRSTNKISNILKSFETKNEDKSHDKPKKSFEFSAEAGKKRAQWQNLERQEKEKSPVAHSRPLGKSTPRHVTTEKPSAKETKDYVEKNIKINQKANNAKGFGFTIQGGVDKKQPVTVQRVNIDEKTQPKETDLGGDKVKQSDANLTEDKPSVDSIQERAVVKSTSDDDVFLTDDAHKDNRSTTDDKVGPPQDMKTLEHVESVHDDFAALLELNTSQSDVLTIDEDVSSQDAEDMDFLHSDAAGESWLVSEQNIGDSLVATDLDHPNTSVDIQDETTFAPDFDPGEIQDDNILTQDSMPEDVPEINFCLTSEPEVIQHDMNPSIDMLDPAIPLVQLEVSTPTISAPEEAENFVDTELEEIQMEIVSTPDHDLEEIQVENEDNLDLQPNETQISKSNPEQLDEILSLSPDPENPESVQMQGSSAADVCELNMKDQIVAINKKDVTSMTQPQVQHLIDVAVKSGHIDLKIRRPISDEDKSPMRSKSSADYDWPSLDDDLEDEAFEESPKILHSKPDHLRTDYHKHDHPKHDHNKHDHPRTDHQKHDHPKHDHNKHDHPRTDHQKHDHQKHDHPRTDHPRNDHAHSSPHHHSHHSNPPHHKTVTSHQQNSPVLRRKEDSHSQSMREEKKSPPVPAKRNSTGRIREDPDEQKRWILEHLQNADPTEVEDEPNNNDLKHEEESESGTESESDEARSPAPVVSPPQQEVVIRPQIEVPRKWEVPREPEREVTETRSTFNLHRNPVPEPYQSLEVITPKVIVKTESVMTPEPQKTLPSNPQETPPPPPPPSAAPPPLKVSNLDVDGYKPPDILRRWQRGSRGTRSDYSSSPTSMDSDGEKRLSSSSFSWQNEAEFNNTGGSQTSPASTMSYEKDFSEQPVEPQVGQPVMLHIDTMPTNQLIIDPRNRDHDDEDSSLPHCNFHIDFNKQNNADDHNQRQREEEEEKDRLREKEERLRRQEEELRQEKERLREEQERIRREKEEIEKLKHKDVETSHAQRNGHHKPSENLTQFSVTKDTSQAQPRRLEEVWNPNNQNNKDKQRWSREDMMAMNRKATPLQMKPENEGTESESRQGVSREPMSRSDLHSLNAAPKPKYTSTNEVTLRRDQKHSDVPRRRSEYSDPNSHWLVEEAERRREKTSKRHSVHTPYHGPIKPVSDSISNRWRDDSSVPLQQTFSSSTSASPRPVNTRQFSANTHQNLSQTLPPNYNMNAGHKREPAVPPKPARRMPASPTSPPSHAEQIMAVSGKQLCSHCNQELGFGAAMVIESLGLYYHVQCFRCCVCHTTLGNGSQGADVRVRVNKLHCRNCYSNDEAGLKFSKV